MWPCPFISLQKLNHAKQQGGCGQLNNILKTAELYLWQDVREKTAIPDAFKQLLKIKPRAMTCHLNVHKMPLLTFKYLIHRILQQLIKLILVKSISSNSSYITGGRKRRNVYLYIFSEEKSTSWGVKETWFLNIDCLCVCKDD